MSTISTSGQPADISRVDHAVAKLVSSFSAYGKAATSSDTSAASAAAAEFDNAITRIRRLIAEISTPALAVPEGYWIAPNSVTPEMTAAALEVDDLYRMGQDDLPGRLFRAMRREAPLPPVPAKSVAIKAETNPGRLQERFETWACSPKGKYTQNELLKFSMGSHQRAVDGLTYVNTAVQQDWEVWQAATV